jgi:DNA recombination protein RmuC
MDPLPLVLGLLVGALVGWLAARARGNAALVEVQAEAAEARGRAEAAEAERKRDQDEMDRVRRALAEAEKAAAAGAATLEAERKRATEQLALFESAEKNLREAFAALSAEALRTNNDAFLGLAKTALGEFQQGARGDLEARQKAIEELLKPVRESLGKVDATIQSVEKARAEAYGSLSQHLVSLGQTQSQLQEETRRLVTALRAPQVRGAWGEMQLRRVVEMAGMLDHCDFHEQVSMADGRLRPDLVVRLPGGKNVVVDSKAPLSAYLAGLEARDDDERAKHLADHARHVREHMDQLGSKAYWGELDDTPEFVVMFLPGEAVFSAALQHDPGLIEAGVKNRVIPASPVTLIALLRSVAYGWSQEKIAEGAQRISDLAQELYERMAVVGEHFAKVGRGLETAVGAYNSAVSSLESRVLPSARKMRELGVPGTRAIETIDPVEKPPRALQAPELKAAPGAAPPAP